MKKNYSEPVIKVQTIALQSMIATSGDGTMGISGERSETGGEVKDNEHLLDGLFD